MLTCCKLSVVETTGHFVLWFSFILALRSLKQENCLKHIPSDDIIVFLYNHVSSSKFVRNTPHDSCHVVITKTSTISILLKNLIVLDESSPTTDK